ncbi:hypothetical protein WA1_40005 [Scytonema hofmannii PCC 7110]|uniref:Uncharacterized protein n=1 Tax=Scytonema hofmannii PCC 7110 TaxID=128403 RepID=A0A139WYW1_9CYAN|nr:hypothetical protein [Scytonema hofmannii]KYC37647.1 hypothetical protein WA1_40005 [Scytonema hofmannii PCC 7110]
MSAIKISDLRPAGHKLFEDSENYLHELTESEMMVVGGNRLRSIVVVELDNISVFAATVVTANANTINANTIGNTNSFVGG